MNQSSFNKGRTATWWAGGENGSAKAVALAGACFLLGAGIGAYCLYHGTKREAASQTGPQTVRELSDVTKSVLRRLNAPIEIRFYSQLDPASVPEAERAFAVRAEELLAAYQREGGSNVKVAFHESDKDFNADAAAADGIKPFNLDKGKACFLGIAVAQGSRKETLPQISAEWEAALEIDVTRAISRLIEANAERQVAAAPAQSDPTIIEAVKRAVPNFETLPLEEGEGILHDAALKELKLAVNEAEAQAKEARQRFTDAQNAGSEADMTAARQRLQQIQTEQMEKLKQISAKAQAQVEALRQLRKAK